MQASSLPAKPSELDPLTCGVIYQLDQPETLIMSVTSGAISNAFGVPALEDPALLEIVIRPFYLAQPAKWVAPNLVSQQQASGRGRWQLSSDVLPSAPASPIIRRSPYQYRAC